MAKPNQRQFKTIGRERIAELFTQAEKAKSQVLANKHVEHARTIAKKLRLRIPADLQKRFCKHCYAYLKPGVTVRVRTQEGHVVYTCLACKKYMRFPYVQEQKAKRKTVASKK